MRFIPCDVILLLVIQFCPLSVSQEFQPKDYCLYGDSCWPSNDVFQQLRAENPTMEIVLKEDDGWEIAGTLVLNQRLNNTPGAVIYVRNIQDIRSVINFTQAYNMDLKLISTGHEFIGRNTANGCVQLSVAKMVDASADLDCPEHHAGCLTAEPGVWWLQAYRVADAVNRTVLGGAEPSVSVTGWSLGGGHSPVSPKLGLGVDQIVELSMVLADLSHVTLNKDGTTRQYIDGSVTTSDETDLFWAVRGGGGGTFGVVTSIKFRLHMPPSKFTTFICEFAAVEDPKGSMEEINKELLPIIAAFPDEFGGYIVSGTICYVEEPCNMVLYNTYVFTHYGARSDNAAVFDQLDAAAAKLSAYLQYTEPCQTAEYESFHDYVQIQPNVTFQYLELEGTFLSTVEYSERFIEEMADMFASSFNEQKYFSTTWIKLGGQTRNDSSGATAINPLFRNAMWTIAYGGDEPNIRKFDKLVERTVTAKAQYFSECDDDLPPGEWQKQFWGQDIYDKLLTTKRKYDPENHFTCVQCVGSGGGGSDGGGNGSEGSGSGGSDGEGSGRGGSSDGGSSDEGNSRDNSAASHHKSSVVTMVMSILLAYHTIST